MYYWVSVLVLVLLLLYPVARLVWVLSVRRMERRLKRELSPAEVDAQKGRAYFIAVLICTLFSLLFNYQVVGYS